MSNERAIDILRQIKTKDAKERETINTAIRALNPKEDIAKCEESEKVI